METKIRLDYSDVKFQDNGKLKLLIIVGREETVAVMTENAKKNRRYTGLKLRLQEKTE